MCRLSTAFLALSLNSRVYKQLYGSPRPSAGLAPEALTGKEVFKPKVIQVSHKSDILMAILDIL